MDKKIDEIEIEEISLDIDDKYEVTLDISSSTEDLLESIKIDQPVEEEVVTGIEESEGKEGVEHESLEFGLKEPEAPSTEEEFSELTSLENIEVPQEFPSQEQEEGDISLSVEELDSILGEAKVEEVTGEGIESEEFIVSEPSSAIEGVDFSASEEAIRFEGEKLSSKESLVGEFGDVVLMSTEEYNKIISEELPPIEEKPVEEVEETVGFEEKFSFEAVSPEELGVVGEKKEEFEISEFAEITEEMVEEQKLNVVESKEEAFAGVGEEVPFEVTETKEGEIIGEFEEISDIGLGEIGLEEVSESQESVGFKEEVEVVDDISISKGEYSVVEEISEAIGIGEEIKYSVTPEEVGIEEIEVSSGVEAGGIVGIGFEEEVKKEKEVGGAEEIISFVEESVGLPEVEEKSIGVSERGAKIEEAIDELSEVEKEALRKVLKYLDKLLESLPEDKVKEFASSEYYDLYVRLFDKLNIS